MEMVRNWIAGVATFISVAAISSMFFMWNTLNRMDAQEPLREQLREIELEQIKKGIQLNSLQLDVTDMELSALEDRIRDLENAG